MAVSEAAGEEALAPSPENPVGSDKTAHCPTKPPCEAGQLVMWRPRRVPAGVKNIHAYSWLAHSRKYLESVERERRHSHAAKVRSPDNA
jgi:hypothetical protein